MASCAEGTLAETKATRLDTRKSSGGLHPRYGTELTEPGYSAPECFFPELRNRALVIPRRFFVSFFQVLLQHLAFFRSADRDAVFQMSDGGSRTAGSQ